MTVREQKYIFIILLIRMRLEPSMYYANYNFMKRLIQFSWLLGLLVSAFVINIILVMDSS